MSRIEGRDLTAALGDCLDQLEAGQSMADLLRPYSGLSAELLPLLETAATLQQLPVTTAPVHVAARIAAALRQEGAGDPAPATHRRRAQQVVRRCRWPAWALARGWRGKTRDRWAARPAAASAPYGAAVLAAVLLVAAGAARASADSLPGGTLYPVKRSLERLHMLVVPSSAESELAARLAARRLAEAAALEAAGRSPAPALDGLAALAPWVDGFPAPVQTAVAAARARNGVGHDADEAATPRTIRPATPEAAGRATVVVRRGAVAALLVGPATPIPAGSPSAPIGAASAAPADEPPTGGTGASAWPVGSPPAPVPGAAETAARPEVTPAAAETTVPATAVTAPHDDHPRLATDTPTTPSEPTEVAATAAATATAVEPRSPGWNVVVGEVLDERGAGLGQAQVSFVDPESGRRIASVGTRGDGTFEHRLRAGSYLVVASAEGHRLQWFRGQPSREGAHPVTLPGDGGRVTVRFRLQSMQPLSPVATPLGREPPPTATAPAWPTAWP